MKKILLIDGSSLLFRAFYAIRNLTTKDGVYVNGVYGFLNMYYKVIDLIKPTHVVVAFDRGSKTFRHKEFSDYKGTRDKAPNEITYQFGILKDLLDSMNIKHIDMDEYEADDILGTISKLGSENGFEVHIFTGDRDYLQLSNENVNIHLTKKGITDIKLMTPETIMEEYGVTPKQLIDVKALQGDSSDNIPGVTGVGEKTALKLIKNYNSIDNLYDNLDELKGKLKENLENEKNMAYLSRNLGEIFLDVPLEYSLDDFKIKEVNKEAYLEKLESLEFKTIINKVFSDYEVTKSEDQEEVNYEVVTFEDLVSRIKEDKKISIKFFSEENYIFRETFYIGIYSEKNKKTFILKSINEEELNKLFELNAVKIGYDFKEELYYLFRKNIEIDDNYEDVMVLEYLYDSNKGNYDIERTAYEELNFKIIDLKEYLGKGKKKITFFELDDEIIFKYISEYSYAICKLYDVFKNKIEDEKIIQLYENIEKPLVKILSDMENIGVKVDRNVLKNLKEIYEKKAFEYENKVYELAGEEFNINSPKQLGVVLFDNMKLPVVKKTKTGYSTDVEVLEKLSQDYEIANYVLEYRSLKKLISTYLDGIESYIMKDNRVRTSYKQTITATGRLSSVDPNLQNIPIRSEEGRNIRKAFVADENKVFIDADYSQIELRVLAHLSDDEIMIDSFKHGIDIHTKTASEVFHVALDEVDSNMRRNAKAVNFGIVYGISDYGLSKDLNITRKEAKKYIDGYLNTYPNIKKYMDDIITSTKETGYVTTILGRKRYVPEINSKNFNIRSFGERIALNTPIQGSAADIIKLAMIEVYNELKKEKIDAKLILQVHDELILECSIEDEDRAREILKNSMEKVYELKLPLKVDISKGENWYESK